MNYVLTLLSSLLLSSLSLSYFQGNKCQPGRYSSTVPNTIGCSACEPGQLAVSESSTECIVSDAGAIVLGGGATSVNVPEGTCCKQIFLYIYIYFLNLYLPLHYKLVITSFIILFQARTKLLAVTKKTSSRALPLNNVQPGGWDTHQLICPAQNVAKDLQVVKVHQKTDVVLATKVLTVSHLGVNHAWNVQ